MLGHDHVVARKLFSCDGRLRLLFDRSRGLGPPWSRGWRQRPCAGQIPDQGDHEEHGHRREDHVHQQEPLRHAGDHPFGDPGDDSPAVGVAAPGSKYPDTVKVVSKSRG